MSKIIKATHYFGRCSMGNFWNTFETSLVDSDFKKIKEYGFNQIILVVPWAAFQPSMKPVEWNNVYFDRLVFLLEISKKYDLSVVLRVGYLWENDKLKRRTYQRYSMINNADFVHQAWKQYIEKLSEVSKEYNTDFFLCWEDFYWPILRHAENLSPKQRIEFSSRLGFTLFVKERYSITLFNHLYDLNIDDFSKLPAPTIHDKWFDEFVLFFDRHFVENMILRTKEVLMQYNLNLIYEHRIDPDVYLPKDGKNERLSIEHSTYKNCVDLDALYYHPKIGRLSSEVYGTAEEAAQHMERFLDTFKVNNVFKSKPFLDQFNFKVQNPKHPDFSLVKEEYMEEYLTLLVPIFKKYLYGYGMWGWRDWRDDKIFNGSFQLQRKGWIGKFILDKENKKVILNKDDTIEQSINQLKGAILSVEYEALAENNILSIVDGNSVVDLTLMNNRSIEYEYQSEFIDTVGLHLKKGKLVIKKIVCYTHTFSNGMLDIEGNDTSSSLLVKQFNKNLK